MVWLDSGSSSSSRIPHAAPRRGIKIIGLWCKYRPTPPFEWYLLSIIAYIVTFFTLFLKLYLVDIKLRAWKSISAFPPRLILIITSEDFYFSSFYFKFSSHRICFPKNTAILASHGWDKFFVFKVIDEIEAIIIYQILIPNIFKWVWKLIL
jgi:hypothetical protein